VASKYADPDLLLKEDWVAPIPGISVKGSTRTMPKIHVPILCSLSDSKGQGAFSHGPSQTSSLNTSRGGVSW